MENPFQFGRELGANELVNRVEEVAEVLTTIRTGGKLFLTGARRYGKTSILKAAADRATASGALVLRYNAEAYPTLDLLVRVMIADTARLSRGGIERTAESIKRFFVRLRPEISYDFNEGTWSATLATADHTTDAPEKQIALLVDAFNAVESFAAEQPKSRRTGLIIDEFQRIIEVGGASAEAQIRAAVQQHKNVGYIFAGSKTRMLTEMTTDATRPFYRLGSLRFIGEIPRQEFADVLIMNFTASNFLIEAKENTDADHGVGQARDTEPAAIAAILDLAEQVPYNVQLLAHICWEMLAAQKSKPTLSVELVTQALERVTRRYDPFYTQLWNALTAIQQKTLITVIAEGGTGMQKGSVARSVGKGVATVQQALRALEGRDILRQEEATGTVRYRFEDPFFDAWIRLFAAKL